MKAVISAPSKIITGIFTVRIALFAPKALREADVEFSKVSGDALGGDFEMAGSGANYQIMYYPDEAVAGVSEVCLGGDFRCRPVRIAYDTHQSVTASFGEVRYEKNKVIVPVLFADNVVGVAKRHFRVSGAIRYSLYGKDRDYELHLFPREVRGAVEIVRQVCKATGVIVEVESERVVWQRQ